MKQVRDVLGLRKHNPKGGQPGSPAPGASTPPTLYLPPGPTALDSEPGTQEGLFSTDAHPHHHPGEEHFPFLSISKGQDICWDIPHMPGKPLECQRDHRLPTRSRG